MHLNNFRKLCSAYGAFIGKTNEVLIVEFSGDNFEKGGGFIGSYGHIRSSGKIIKGRKFAKGKLFRRSVNDTGEKANRVADVSSIR